MGRLSKKQLERLSEFTANLGLVFFAVVVTPLFAGVDTINVVSVLLGLIATIGSSNEFVVSKKVI